MRRPLSVILLALFLTAVGLFYLPSRGDISSQVSRLKTGAAEQWHVAKDGAGAAGAAVADSVAGAVADVATNKQAKEHSVEYSLPDLTKGKPIMKKMANQTLRAELGRAAWKVFHTILAQYPDEPSEEARQTLHNYIKLFSRVYPCAECAEHFQALLAQFPPQLSSRKVAVMWGCDAHNKVNKRLGKEIFDCAYIDDKYDCGCGPEDEDDEDEVIETEKAGPAVNGG